MKNKTIKKGSMKEELKRAREDLEDLETYIKEFSYFLPLAICALNPPKFIIDVNQSFQKLTGYKSSEIIGETLDAIFPEEEIDLFLDWVRKEGTTRSKELVLVSKDKKDIPVSVSASVRKDSQDNFIGYFIALFDITEIKKFREEMEIKIQERTKELESSRKALMNILEDVEEERRRAEEEKSKTLAVITNLADGLLVFDKENKLLLINHQAEKFLNVKTEEIMGNSVLELAKIPNFKALIDLIGVNLGGVFRKKLLIGDKFVIEASTTPMVSRRERLGTLIILHDITREEMVERIKTEFVSLAAHQLKTPLSAIKWTLKMLLDGDLGEITSEQKNFIDKTYQSNERMIGLINDLLDVTRVEEGKYLYKPVPTDIESVVCPLVDLYKEEAQKRNINLEFKRPEKKSPKVKVDAEKIRLAIQNLLDNAVKYTPRGGKVTISFKSGKKEIEFSIKDTGVGIPQDQQNRLFTKFFRGANVIRMETEGSGLGLFLSKNIIEAHGGRIWFESEEGAGTTFYFTLPTEKEFGEFLKEF